MFRLFKIFKRYVATVLVFTVCFAFCNVLAEEHGVKESENVEVKQKNSKLKTIFKYINFISVLFVVILSTLFFAFDSNSGSCAISLLFSSLICMVTGSIGIHL
jgi:predicted tellurium resistance membrane protein TerC